MSAITRDEVAHLARLARLDLPEDALTHYAEQLDVIPMPSPWCRRPPQTMSPPRRTRSR